MQSKFLSACESVVNVLIGYTVATLSQLLIFPMFDIYVTISNNFLIGAYFTTISLVRSYFIRRIFNYKSKTKE